MSGAPASIARRCDRPGRPGRGLSRISISVRAGGGEGEAVALLQQVVLVVDPELKGAFEDEAGFLAFVAVGLLAADGTGLDGAEEELAEAVVGRREEVVGR